MNILQICSLAKVKYLIKFLSEPFKIGTGNAVEFEDPFGNRLGVTDYIK